MFQLPEIHGAAGGLANVEGWAKNGGVWAKNGGGLGKECILWAKSVFLWAKSVISLGKENLMIPGWRSGDRFIGQPKFAGKSYINLF